MKATKLMLFALLFAVVAFLFAGCSNSSNPPDASNSVLTSLPVGGLVFSAPTGNTDMPQPLTLTNAGNAPLTISDLELSDSTSFALTASPSLPTTVAPGAAITLTVGFNALTLGPKNATLTVQSDGVAATVVALHGLSFKGTGGNNEPSLQWILDALAIPVEVGDSDPTTTPIDGPTGGFVGEEIAAQTFRKAGSGAVTVEVLAAFAVENDPVVRFGWYRAGDASTTRAVFEVPQTSPDTPPNNAQRLMPDVTGTLSFDPGSAPFGLYAFWPSNQFFAARTTYTEDTLNTFPKALPHHFRTFPYKNADGTVEPNVYIVTNNEFHLGDDFNDVVVIVRNVTPL